MQVGDAQRDIGRAYVGGGPGVIFSALTWLVAAYVERIQGVNPAFIALFIGGMFIFPVSKLLSRFAFGRANEAKDNPLGLTALECTIAMIGGLFAAWLFLPLKPEYAFPLAAIAVGTHYFVFKTVYGDRTFWALGAVLTAIGVNEIAGSPVYGGPILAVAVAELVCGAILTVWAVRA